MQKIEKDERKKKIERVTNLGRPFFFSMIYVYVCIFIVKNNTNKYRGKKDGDIITFFIRL